MVMPKLVSEVILLIEIGLICSHRIPYRFLNFISGEMYIYCLLLLDDYISNNSDESDEKFMVFAYDIQCLFQKSIMKKRHMYPRIVNAFVATVIPIFHVYGHQVSCQLDYSPRRTKHAGYFNYFKVCMITRKPNDCGQRQTN